MKGYLAFISLGLLFLGFYVPAYAGPDQQKGEEGKAESPGDSGEIVWKNPTSGTCTGHGGIFNSANICSAAHNSATSICDAETSRLPTLGELKAVVVGCGGVLEDNDKNRDNAQYAECYQAAGFSSEHYYWSSSTENGDTEMAWGVYVARGLTFYSGSNNKYYVRCVAEPQEIADNQEKMSG